MKRQTGVALIVVLWLVALLSLMAASFGLGIRREASLASVQVRDASLLAACEAGVHYATFMVNHPDPQLKWIADGTLKEWEWDGIKVRIRIFDESGKVDINKAGPVLLKTVLKLAGVEEEEADRLSDVIQDWRDGDQLRRLNGAESPDYVAAGLNYEPSNQPFESIDELSMVMGMKPALFSALLPWVTIYNKRNGINPLAASAELLRALPGIDLEAVEQFIQAREQRQTQGQLAPPPQPLPQVEGVHFFSGSGHTYTVLVRAESQQKTLSVYTVVKMLKDQLRYLAWREGLPKSLFESPQPESDLAPRSEDTLLLKDLSPAAMTR